MWKKDYNLWLNYHKGNIKRDLTEKEQREIKACEFAMHLLIPDDDLIKVSGGINSLKQLNKAQIIELSEKFWVSSEMMKIKIASILESEKENQEKKLTKQN